MPGWMWLLASIIFTVALAVFLWGTGTIRVGKERGGTVDLSAAAARGELDLDWSDPRRRKLDEARALYERGAIPFGKKPPAPPLNPSNRG